MGQRVESAQAAHLFEVTILSSFRPHKDSLAYRENQIRAHQSWEGLVDEIVYFGEAEPELQGDNTRFHPSPNWPFIWVLAEYAAKQKCPVAIVNADIVLEEPVKRVFEIVATTSIGCATSRRRDLETRQIIPNDNGRDIFICKPKLWGKVARDIPRSCRIGHQMWDAWAVGYMRKTIGKRFADFTQLACVFHPRHEERLTPYSQEIHMDGPFYGFNDGSQDTGIA